MPRRASSPIVSRGRSTEPVSKSRGFANGNGHHADVHEPRKVSHAPESQYNRGSSAPPTSIEANGNILNKNNGSHFDVVNGINRNMIKGREIDERQYSAKLSEIDVYESSRYDALLLKEDLKNTNWLHSVDDKFDQGSLLFDNGFENLPEPFEALLRIAVKNGLPLFTFAVNQIDGNILAAKVKNLGDSGKDECNRIYTFLTFSEVKKKNGSWMSRSRPGVNTLKGNTSETQVSVNMPRRASSPIVSRGRSTEPVSKNRGFANGNGHHADVHEPRKVSHAPESQYNRGSSAPPTSIEANGNILNKNNGSHFDVVNGITRNMIKGREIDERQYSAKLSEIDVYESSRYDALLLKEDLKNTNWLHSVDDKFDQGSLLSDNGFENLPEPFEALLRIAVKNGLPLFTFAVNQIDGNILASKVKNLGDSGKDECNRIYTFLTFSEVKKKNGSWMSKAGRSKEPE
ncbi:hypothetical protein RYX36_016711 [Vicia faba]